MHYLTANVNNSTYLILALSSMYRKVSDIFLTAITTNSPHGYGICRSCYISNQGSLSIENTSEHAEDKVESVLLRLSGDLALADLLRGEVIVLLDLLQVMMYPWSSSRTIVPLVIGIVILVVFDICE